MSIAKKRRMKDLPEVLRHAVKLFQEGSSRELVDFVARFYPRYPQSLDLAKLWYFGCRELDAPDEAAGVALEMISEGHHLDQALAWLWDLRADLSDRNDRLMKRAARLKGLSGSRAQLFLFLFYGNAIQAERLFREMHQKWPENCNYSVRNFANALFDLKCFEHAEKYFWQALEKEPEDLRLMSNLVDTMLELEKLQFREKATEAANLAEAMIRRYPEAPESLYAMGMVWLSASRPDRAHPYHDRYFAAFPQHPRRSGFTFNLSYLEDMSKEETFQRRLEWCELHSRLTEAKSDLPLVDDFNPNRRLRVGYVSPDFGKHPVGYFCKSIFPYHDADEVDVFLYSERNPVTDNDQVTQEFRAMAGDNWRCLYGKGALPGLSAVREDKIDILVDLAGHSNHNRLDLFGNRGAPIQVEWLGFPGSTGLKEMDYRISDEIIEPEGEADELSSERIIRMPHGFHCITFPEDLPEPTPPPCLENGYITFGSFNNCNKIGSKSVALWARVLREIPNARLLLKHKTMDIFANRESFRSLFVAEGVDPARIRFDGTTVSQEEHFAHYAKMDVALDPVAYNGTTTTCEALYMGVPVLTLLGDSHPSRVSASLLHRMGMDGWVAQNENEYVRIAMAAAARPDALEKRRAVMRETYLKSALADGPSMARDLEQIYRKIWREKCAEENS